jgi:Tol biopolymer transport system component/predicted Ser/Thr protein kinase
LSITVGTQLGSYEITSLLGKGGMGEVYRARDTKLKREVAIKILPEEFSRDPGRMLRFQREAEVLASLNHSNIAAIYGVEERALVMELVEGESPKGPMPFDEAWRIASQIAFALEYAHDKGVVHRDLKPANVKITPEGAVKLLDFGLAKAFSGQPAMPAADPANSPTLTLGASEVGMIVGTAAYMPPEQAKGKSVDKRADIWAFGVVLYELLTGERLFKGEDVSDTLAQVLTKEPEFERVPAKARRLLRECLEKDPKQRLRDIGDARRLLEDEPQDPVTAPSRSRLGWVAWAVASMLALALGVTYFGRTPERPRVLKLSVLPPEKATFSTTGVPAVSPDGRRLAFAATVDGKTSLWVRDLDSLTARPLAGTEGTGLPFWSPDSRFIAFFAGGKLKKIDVSGGPALTLCEAGNARGGSWSNTDVIVFTPNLASGLFRVPVTGGNATPVTAPDQALGETSHRWPWFLPDGRHFLYTARNDDPEKTTVYVADLDSKNRRRVLAANSNAVYSPPGYLLFVRERTLMAQPFDAVKAQTTGDPFPIAEQVDYLDVSIAGRFAVSQNGVLAYTSGVVRSVQRLTWFDRFGKVAGTVGEPGDLNWPAISPDGNTVVVARRDPQTGVINLWLHDPARGTASRFTFNSGEDRVPVWSPDGSHIAFSSIRDGFLKLYQKATSGVAQDEALDKAQPRDPSDWSRDGHYIIEVARDPGTKADIWVLPLFGDRKPFPFLQTEFNEVGAKLSPNGQWLAYQSDETRRNEVYVQTFPTPGRRVQVSTNGGSSPVWSRDGKELFFIGADQKMMAVEVKNGGKFGVPRALFDTRLGGLPFAFDVSKDGRFLIPTLVEQAASVPMTVVVDWTAGLKK